MNNILIGLIVVFAIAAIVQWGATCPCGCPRWMCGCENMHSGDVNTRRFVTLHYTNWCHYCKQMKPVWATVKASLADSGVQFRELDEDVAKTPGVTGYPTILMLDEKGHSHKYNGIADATQLRNWIVAPTPYG